MLLVLIVAVGVIWLFHKYWTSVYNYWEEKGIAFEPAKFPYGSNANLVNLKEFRGYVLDQMYYQYARHPFFGIFLVRKPILIVRDPELLRLILTKDFAHFRDRRIFELSENDVLNHHLFNVDGETWRALRLNLTPTFTSGKIKAMFPLFISCAEAFSTLLHEKLGSKVDVKELISRYTADIICSCAFGLEMDVINHPNNKLREIGMKIFKADFLTSVKLAMTRILPQMSKLLSIRLTSLEDENYVINMIKTVIEQRENCRIKRNDFIDLLIQLKNKGNVGNDVGDEDEKEFDMNLGVLAAQCFVFFIAGFETSSSVQSFCLYELAIHQDIQSRLREEIDSKINKHGGITYVAVQEMEYLNTVISETLRKYPTLPTLVRHCSKSYMTPNGFKIDEGTMIIVPVWSLHHDAQYFPEPEKFDPERFSEENKDSISSYTYLPFGEGPRTCIGMRFGLLQTKVGIVTLLNKFKVETCEETKIPLTMDGTYFTTVPKDPIILKLVERSN